MNRVELIMRRRQVKAFINADPVDIIPERVEMVRTPAGGTTKGPVKQLDPVRVRIVNATRRFVNMQINTEAGSVPHSTFLLLAPHDAGLLEGDLFTWGGADLVVTSIHPSHEERLLAFVDYRR